jgi:signal transduction histidine kinase
MASARRAGATLLYLTSALVMGALGLALVFSGWLICLLLVITPLVVPALIGFQAAVAYVAGAEAWLARGLVGASAQPAVPALATGRGYWRRGWDAARDPAFYRQQIFMVGRWLVGSTIAIVEWSLIAIGLFGITLPITYRWLDGPNIGTWKIHTLSQALVGIPLGIIVLVLAIWLLRPLESLSCWAADDLLGGGGPGVAPESVPEPAADGTQRPTTERQRFAMAAVTCAGISGVVLIIWLFTGAGTFWPGWVIISLGIPLAYWAWAIALREQPHIAADLRMTPKMARIVGRGVALSVFCFLVWALSGGNSSVWPIYVILVVIARIVVAVVIEINDSIRKGPLAERITVLETSRAGAVDQQEAELRRIERDLHDGAQARLVALGMSLGMAQQKLDADDPAAARELLADARSGAQEALQELRDLARGIHPPVLADRGLEAAIAALADRTPLRITVGVDLPQRPAPAVETATYFVVAEALANAAKHAQATMVDIAIGQVGTSLIAEVRDDGIGGARPQGSGLTGLARRVEALDGTFTVTSPIGGPTLIRAVMPCGS